MVNFVFSNEAGLNMNLQTDLIGLASGADNFTIINKLDSSGEEADLLFQDIQTIKNTKEFLVQFASDNNLTLKAYEGQDIEVVTLNEEVIESE